MTVEEVEIIVTAQVTEALKEIQKIVPVIKKVVKEAQASLEKLDTDVLKYKFATTVQYMKKKLQDLKKVSENSEIKIKVNNEEAQKQISQVQKKISSLKKQIEARKLELKVGIVTEKIDIAESSQNKMANSLGVLKAKTEQVKPTIENIKKQFEHIPNITQKITTHIKGMADKLKQGIGYVVKYIGTLFNLKNVYSNLKSLASSWLSSQNADAQQLSANIEYMKYAMGSVLAPAIQFVTNLVYKLMKAIQSVVYAFSGVNIFAKANEINNVSDNSGGGSEGGSIGTTMDLSKIDSQMSTLSQKIYDFFKPLKDSWDNYGEGLIQQIKNTAGQIGGFISSVWGSFENIITNGTVYTILQNILAIIGNIAEAFSNAWNNNGNGDVVIQNLSNAFNNLLNAINNVVESKSFQDFLILCSDKIREISEKIGEINWQPLVDALTEIGTKIGTFALDILDGLVEVFKWLVENPDVAEILLTIAVAIGAIATVLGILSTIMGILTPIATALGVSITSLILPIIVITLAIAAVIAIIVLCIKHWEEIKNVVMNVVNAIVEFITNLWNQVSFVFEAIWDVISTVLNFIWDMFATVFEAIWNIVSPILNAIWTIISTVFETIWNIISSILTSVWNIFSQIFNWVWQLVSTVFKGIFDIISPIMTKIWEGIKAALEGIKEIWSTVWETISTVVINIWNGIWNGIKGIINVILGGIESFVNGVIEGVNFILSGISKVANKIGSFIGLDPINLRLNLISLPRLAKGGVLTEATLLIAGEYSGAKSNPEIVTPQNIMYDTMRKALLDSDIGNNNNRSGLEKIEIHFGSSKVAYEIVDLLNQARRKNGKAILEI